MQRRYILYFAKLCLLVSVISFCKLEADNEIPSCETLDYSTAVNRFLSHSNLLKVSELGVEIKEAEQFQTGLCHNPEFTIEYESGDSDNKAELTYVLSQTFELGGKHSLERKIAAIETCAAMWDHEISKLDLLLEFTHAFIDAATAQEKLKLAEEQSKLAEQSLSCMKERFKHGKTSALFQKKSTIQCCCKNIAKVKAKQNFEIARTKLALMWGLQQPDFNGISYPFYQSAPLPVFQELEATLEFSPEYSKGLLGRWAAEASTELERANRYPDLEVSAGIQTEQGFRSPSFVVEFSFPLPIFDHNQGNISRAIFQEWQAVYLQENLITILKSNLSSSYAGWQAAYEAAQALKEIAQTTAEENVHDSQEGYDRGKFEMLEILEAQKDSLEVQDQYIDALAEYHHKKAETLRLVGNSQWNN